MKLINVITIDGPSASGKGALARKIANKFSLNILDSGILYRLFAYFDNLSIPHSEIAKKIQQEINFNLKTDLLQILNNEKDITIELRSEDIAKTASKLSSQKEVRSLLFNIQRSFYTSKGLVADGRDMGTVVFPEAATKIFLIADVEVRAERRFLELQNAGQGVNMRDLIEDIRLRDEADRAREISPLVPAADSVEVNSSNLTPQEVLNKVLQIYKEHIKEI